MNRPQPVEYTEASPEVRAVFDDIKASRKVADVNNFWKYLASDPALLKRTWDTQKEVLEPGELDLLVKEMIYLAVSVTNGCSYGIACHTAFARKAGMTTGMFSELMAVVGMANQTNRFADGYRLPIDATFDN
jgi:AhpD family alkylhydroperoxidase